MDRWMAAFPNTANQERDDKEVIYEDWGEDKRIQNSHTPSVMRVMKVYNFICVCGWQTVLRCSAWSSTSPSKPTSSAWSPLRSSTSSAKPTRVRASGGKRLSLENKLWQLKPKLIIIIINICYTEKVTCTNMTLYHLPGLCLFICLHPPTLALAVYLL